MNAMYQIYKRYFKYHFVALALICLGYIFAAAEGSMLSGIGKYLIDDVLQVDQILKPILHGQPGEFIGTGAGVPTLPREQAVFSNHILDRPLPGEMEKAALQSSDVQADGSLQDRIAARTGMPNAQKIWMLAVVAVLMLFLHILCIGSQTFARFKLGIMTKQVVFRMRRHIHEKLMRLQLSFHDQHQTGRLLSRAVDDIQVIEGHFAPIMTTLAQMVGLVIINVSIMYYLSPKLTFISLALMPLYFYVHKVLVHKIRELQRTQRRQNAALYGLIRDRLANPRVIKGFGQERRENIRFFDKAKDLFRRNRRIVILNNLLSQICTILVVISSAVPLGFGIRMVQSGEMTVGSLLFFYGVCWGVFWPLAALSMISGSIQMVRISCERILEVLDEPIIIADKSHARQITGFNHSLEIKDLSFKYRPENPLALEGINLTIPKSAKICLMGSSGAGKSTLAMQLLRLYDPTSGDIIVDGVNLKDVKITHWRRRISFVPQEPVLFSGTLAGNITYGNAGATEEQIIAAAKAAEIHDFIEGLPDKYQTVIGENGLRLSGGQKQRVSLARALVTDPDILVLDDCTSALDAETESRIQTTFKNALAGKTVVMISHRVSASSNADTIVVLDHGKVVEVGEHQELFDRQGAYWNLVKDQLAEHAISLVSMPEKKSKPGCAAA